MVVLVKRIVLVNVAGATIVVAVDVLMASMVLVGRVVVLVVCVLIVDVLVELRVSSITDVLKLTETEEVVSNLITVLVTASGVNMDIVDAAPIQEHADT